MRIKLLICAILLGAFVVPTFACLWDYDSLRAEANGLPGVAEIITGRFERNPPLYYEMRLARSTQSIEQYPKHFDAYDDAGVACDRLGRSDDAIAWMARKDAAMTASGEEPAALADHRYRYLANLGTFHAHRWFNNGANRNDMADLERAVKLISAAISLNPDAHFGRERYQLLALKWILDPPMRNVYDGKLDRLPTFFDVDEAYCKIVDEHGERVAQNLAHAGYTDAVQGLTGLIALGNAWQSVDLFHTLEAALTDRHDASLARLAKLRYTELVHDGRNSLHPAAPQGDAVLETMFRYGYEPEDQQDIDAYYKKARAAADAWQEHRTQFMLTKLEQGMHPDTHENFWAGYEELTAPSMPNGVLGVSRTTAAALVPIVAIACVGGIIALILMRLLRRTRNKPAESPIL